MVTYFLISRIIIVFTLHATPTSIIREPIIYYHEKLPSFDDCYNYLFSHMICLMESNKMKQKESLFHEIGKSKTLNYKIVDTVEKCNFIPDHEHIVRFQIDQFV